MMLLTEGREEKGKRKGRGRGEEGERKGRKRVSM